MNNPHAFARPSGEYHGEGGRVYAKAQPGMTLLDYFAGQALTGIVTRSDSASHGESASMAYIYAIEMLEQRAGYLKMAEEIKT